ncbi:MAG: hypothetical protein JWN84_4461 [Nocardioides sp.]|nr:hypothetical protein [Nocardioides sp.]
MPRTCLALVCALVLVLGAAPAPAARWHHVAPPEPRPGYGDIVSATVVAGEQRVRLRLESGRVPYQTVFFIDVDADRPGPEFTAYRFSDGAPFNQRVFVYRSRDWSGYSDETRCRPRTALVSADSRVLTASFALRCLGYQGSLPTRLRVAVHTRDDAVGTDWAPGARRELGRWVRVG